MRNKDEISPMMQEEFRIAKHLRKILHLDNDIMEWISVNDRTHDSLEMVLFTDGKDVFKGYSLKSIDEDSYAWFSDNDLPIYGVTHWMPLPLPPGD